MPSNYYAGRDIYYVLSQRRWLDTILICIIIAIPCLLSYIII